MSEEKDINEEIERLRKELERKERNQRAARLRAATTTMFVAIAGLVLSTSLLFGTLKNKPLRIPAEPNTDSLNTLRANLAMLQDRVAKLDQLTKAAYLTAPSADTSTEQRRLAAEVVSLNDRMTKIEDAISESPEKALSIPLLRKDVEDTSKRLGDYRDATRADIDRLYELQKWILGGIGVFLLTAIGWAASMIYKSLPGNKSDI
ncbi:hypothetical protein [Dyella psychrodurans]|uniref:Uncharacterized protein n=1 Tax=Dyella psychrodurans TaxID=1927960 RepID=A0A370WXU3_9GAMM|nr:hypothetical protein [Dyella psychrodurans]RDS80959.1 hypothetical protein DWU99_18060 [Dyella psychrodurans]